jgi:hypothetical protein
MLAMKDKEIKIKFEEPVSGYEVNESLNLDSDEMHPVLKQLLEQSIKEADAGLGIPHDEVMKKIKEKYPFLK